MAHTGMRECWEYFIRIYFTLGHWHQTAQCSVWNSYGFAGLALNRAIDQVPASDAYQKLALFLILTPAHLAF